MKTVFPFDFYMHIYAVQSERPCSICYTYYLYLLYLNKMCEICKKKLFNKLVMMLSVYVKLM